MAIEVHGDNITSDQTKHVAWRPGLTGWRVSWLPGREMDRNAAITAMMLADMVATNELHCEHPAWDEIDAWARELGLPGPDAVVMASEPPDSKHPAAGQ